MANYKSSYVARFSTRECFGAIRAFYDHNLQFTNSVFRRPDDVLEHHADLGRFITVWDDQNKLAALSALFTVANGQEIDCVVHDDGTTEKGTVADLGGVLRRGLGPNDAVDKGFWRFLLFTLPLIAVIKNRLPVDIVIAGVNNTAKGEFTKDYIRGDFPGSPMKCGRIIPAREFLVEDAILLSTPEKVVDPDDLSKNSQHFRAYAQGLVPVATALAEVIETGFVKDMRRRNSIGYKPSFCVPVDLSELGIESIIKCILNNKEYFEDAPSSVGLAEVGREIRSRARQDGLRGLEANANQMFDPAAGQARMNGTSLTSSSPVRGAKPRRLITPGGGAALAT